MIQDRGHLLQTSSSKYYLQANNSQALVLQIKPKKLKGTNKDSNLKNKRAQFKLKQTDRNCNLLRDNQFKDKVFKMILRVLLGNDTLKKLLRFKG